MTLKHRNKVTLLSLFFYKSTKILATEENLQPSNWFTGNSNNSRDFLDHEDRPKFYILTETVGSRADIEDHCSSVYNASLWCPKNSFEEKQVFANLFYDAISKKRGDILSVEDIAKFGPGPIGVWTGIKASEGEYEVFEETDNDGANYYYSYEGSYSLLNLQCPSNRAGQM